MADQIELRTESIAVPRLPGDGVWMAFYDDDSSYAAFPSELDALRHAVGNSMEVEFTPWGMSPNEARRARWAREQRNSGVAD